jgi:hypothetical protein
MNDKERSAIRNFLNFNLSLPKDIYIHDKMANGMVEAPRAPILGIAGTSSNPGPENSSRYSDTSSRVSGYQPSYVSSKGEDIHTPPSGRPPINRRTSVLNHHSPPVQASSYQVTIASSGSLTTGYTRPNSRTKLDLKQMDGTVYTDENSVDSRTNLEHMGGSSKKRSGSGDSEELNTQMIPNLSLIQEEDEIDFSMKAQQSGGLDEDLLRIGMKKEKKKSGCCNIS